MAIELKNILSDFSLGEVNPDDFYDTNITVFDIQEGHFTEKGLYCALSFLCVALLDLGLIEVDDE